MGLALMHSRSKMAQDSPQAVNPTNWRGLNLLGFALMEVRARLGSTD
jgi:hypothetical protein